MLELRFLKFRHDPFPHEFPVDFIGAKYLRNRDDKRQVQESPRWYIYLLVITSEFKDIASNMSSSSTS
jgi:hypothetical protein